MFPLSIKLKMEHNLSSATAKNLGLAPYRDQIVTAIQEQLVDFGDKNVLRDGCEYALMNGGKRVRPAIVLALAEALGGKPAIHPALAIEYFHTASLVADDLPCMDDDDERRNKPSVHKVYGETLALLVSYALIAAGYGCIEKGGRGLLNADRVVALALQNSAYNTGLLGATGGQFLDIYPPDLSLPTILEVIHKKTVSLFEITFVFGWLFGGGSEERLPLVKKAASHYGTAFQIADDLGDMEQDSKNERLINLANLLGKEEAERMLEEEIASYKVTMSGLGLENSVLFTLADELSQSY